MSYTGQFFIHIIFLKNIYISDFGFRNLFARHLYILATALFVNGLSSATTNQRAMGLSLSNTKIFELRMLISTIFDMFYI